MKIVIASEGPDLNAPVSFVFGRAPYFIVYDLDTDTWQAYPNPAQGAMGGAGPMAANFVAQQGASLIVVNGMPGPNAMGILGTLGIRFVQFAGTVKEAVDFVRLNAQGGRPITREEEIAMLKREKEWIEKRLKEIEKQLG